MMGIRYVYTILLICIRSMGFSQGHIEHIKQQTYLKFKDKVNCNAQPADNLSERICANLTFQKADSILTVIYEELITKSKQHHIDSLVYKIETMQTTWRLFRDQHCAIVYDHYEGCGGCHQQAIDYLYCLTELTNNRIKELKGLKDQVSGERK